MPFYSFECPNCEVVWDEFRLIGDRNKICKCRCGIVARRHMVYAVATAKDTRYKDKYGQTIWFPNDERPYYDRALEKTFHSKKEKHQYMMEKNLAMDGSEKKIGSDVAVGDTRSRSFRKSTMMED